MAFIDIAGNLVIYLCIVRVFLLHILAEIHSKYLNSSLAMPVFSKNLIFFFGLVHRRDQNSEAWVVCP